MHDDPRNSNFDKKGKGKGMEQGKYNKEDATKFSGFDNFELKQPDGQIKKSKKIKQEED